MQNMQYNMQNMQYSMHYYAENATQYENKMQNMQKEYVKPFTICRIVTSPDFAYFAYVCTPHFAHDGLKPLNFQRLRAEAPSTAAAQRRAVHCHRQAVGGSSECSRQARPGASALQQVTAAGPGTAAERDSALSAKSLSASDDHSIT